MASDWATINCPVPTDIYETCKYSAWYAVVFRPNVMILTNVLWFKRIRLMSLPNKLKLNIANKKNYKASVFSLF